MRVVLASNNRGKLNELAALLAPLGYQLVSQQDLNIESAPETGATFIENALQKARHACDHARLPAIADDSGLVVEALNGAPGIRSARYAGDECDDAANNRLLLDGLSGVDNRNAHFYCALVFLQHCDDPAPLVATGVWRGEIITSPRGSSGFGYDPLFYLPELDRTAAELDPSEKNRLSHRGQAVTKLCQQLKAKP